MMRRTLLLALAAGLLSAAAPGEDHAAPYRILQQANRSLDASLAASAYAEKGQLIFEYPGQPVETFNGSESIRSAYVRTFSQVDAGTPIDLEFRFEPPGLAASQQRGVYRIRATAGGRNLTLYGRFSVKLVKSKGAWRFGEDRGTAATAADFEGLPDTAQN